MYRFKTLDDCEVKGERVLVRVDMNSPLNKETKRVEDKTKIASTTGTLGELSDKGAKVTVIAHQGRSDHWDFVDLSEHAEILSGLLSRDVRYVDDLCGEKAKSAIESLKDGEILVLKNVRSYRGETEKLSAEEHAQGELVSNLAPLFDLFVNDAFASAHRSHTSMIGFTAVLPSVAGRLMVREIEMLSKLVDDPERPCVFVLGGTKLEDALPVISTVLDNGTTDSVLLGGLIGLAFLSALREDIGGESTGLFRPKLTHENLDKIREISRRFGDKVSLPIDVAVDDDGMRVEHGIDSLPADLPALDIGSKTISRFEKTLSSAKTILISGPVGVFEREQFAMGTRAIFETSTASGAFCVIGGGHTIAAANQLGFADKITYASTGGGALENFILGKSLPAIDALVNSAGRFWR